MVFSLSCAAATLFWSFVTVSCAAWTADSSDDTAEVSLATFVLSVATAASAAVHALEVPVVPDEPVLLPAHAVASAASSLFSWFCAEVRAASSLLSFVSSLDRVCSA